uniref:Uncharacterized protein n=1 Tax=Arundo donax TaxID=35708 RepID=A0A0A9EN97_ARUDO
MALEMASAVQTPLPLPDMSSPSSSFENLSFIISISDALCFSVVVFSSQAAVPAVTTVTTSADTQVLMATCCHSSGGE